MKGKFHQKVIENTIDGIKNNRKHKIDKSFSLPSISQKSYHQIKPHLDLP